MSWSDDTRCLYCDGKLALYRKITSGQFCSAAHRKAYWQEQEKLAVERLHQTHDSLRAYRPPEALEVPRVPEPSSSGIFPSPLSAGVGLEDASGVDDLARSAANTGRVKFAGFLTEAKPDARSGARVTDVEPLDGDLDLVTWSADSCFLGSLNACAIAGEWQPATRTPIPFFEAIAFDPALRFHAASEVSALVLPSAWTPRDNVRIPFVAAPETPEFEPSFIADLRALEAAVVEVEPVAVEPVEVEAAETTPVESIPVTEFSVSLQALARIGSHAGQFVPRAAVTEPVLASSALKPRYARMADGDRRPATPAMAVTTGLLALEVSAPPKNSQPRTASEPLAADLGPALYTSQVDMDLPALGPELRFAPGSRYKMSGGQGVSAPRGKASTTEAPRLLDLKLNAWKMAGRGRTELALGLRLAAGCRYTVSFRPGQIGKAPVMQADLIPTEARPKLAIVGLPADLGASNVAPAFPRLQPLAFHAQPRPILAAQPDTSGLLQVYPENPPMQPATKWEPIEGQLQPPLRTGFLSTWSEAISHIGENKDGERKHIWSHASDFWQHAPRDLKVLVIAIPVLLALALRPSLPKVQVKAPVAGPSVAKAQSAFERDFRERLQVVRRSVAERAGVALSEDFRTGLDDWQSRGDMSTAWSFDSNGFVKPGTLALYRPSLNLSDYEMDFLGLIDKKALSWVVRAADFDNYYVVKIVVLKPGPMPTVGITRYAVINGRAQDRVDTLAAINARTDMLYRVNMNVREDSFLLTIQGTVVDNWSDPRLRKGGVGFFSQQGEESRLRWLQITHQYDMLGRLCAYLAPYNIPTTNGSW
jgi:hypothetical protein